MLYSVYIGLEKKMKIDIAASCSASIDSLLVILMRHSQLMLITNTRTSIYLTTSPSNVLSD